MPLVAHCEGAIKQTEETIKNLEGITYNAAQAGTTADLQNIYNEGSAQLFGQDTGLTRGQASDRTVSQIIKGLEEAENIEGLEALRDVTKVPGQKGTELGRTFGRDIDAAIERVKSGAKARRTARVAEIENRMHQQLAGARTSAEREVIVRAAAEQMRQANAWKAADTLLGDFEALNQPGGVEINDVRVLESVTAGEITTEGELKRLQQSGQISADGYKNALEALNEINDAKPPNDPVINRQVDSYGDAFDVDFLTAVD